SKQCAQDKCRLSLRESSEKHQCRLSLRESSEKPTRAALLSRSERRHCAGRYFRGAKGDTRHTLPSRLDTSPTFQAKRERIETRLPADRLSSPGSISLLRGLDVGAFLLGGPVWRTSLARRYI